ncbi:hypothetical protein HMPREF0495_02288 [Levilactobacillus brevis ATCC 14869 = DSM 20054]|uniref:Uncharacterized protein n=2 Tax=Levilactobacillus brevis TaxID=1580 RepID=Q03SJ9_LEVBA|nr:hypothetical protein LVIS_0680 [Levilactobacillus brevis ATCC 367]AJA80716.1 hypothetical protein L747_02500 [Levilactobacillus brevis BSO 464]ERK41270.1 hypothetical protein HMPREF0495_02288 [Levilactobacillus brevis ATCC 14869 = DSM 20054]
MWHLQLLVSIPEKLDFTVIEALITEQGVFHGKIGLLMFKKFDR